MLKLWPNTYLESHLEYGILFLLVKVRTNLDIEGIPYMEFFLGEEPYEAFAALYGAEKVDNDTYIYFFNLDDNVLHDYQLMNAFVNSNLVRFWFRAHEFNRILNIPYRGFINIRHSNVILYVSDPWLEDVDIIINYTNPLMNRPWLTMMDAMYVGYDGGHHMVNVIIRIDAPIIFAGSYSPSIFGEKEMIKSSLPIYSLYISRWCSDNDEGVISYINTTHCIKAEHVSIYVPGGLRDVRIPIEKTYAYSYALPGDAIQVLVDVWYANVDSIVLATPWQVLEIPITST